MSGVMDRTWMRPRGLRGTTDGGTWVVLLLWLGILLLVPARPPGATDSPPAPVCMISTWSEPLAGLPLARRPDLVTLPSAVSFGASGPAVDSLLGVPPFRRHTGKPLPPRADDDRRAGHGASSAASLRRAAAESLVSRPSPLALTGDGKSAIPASMDGWRVLCSPGLENTRLSAAFTDAFKPPADVKHIQAELWVQFDDSGRPLELFIEKGEDLAIVRELVRQLWNPANWTTATGQGRINIRYVARTGGTDANKIN